MEVDLAFESDSDEVASAEEARIGFGSEWVGKKSLGRCRRTVDVAHSDTSTADKQLACVAWLHLSAVGVST